MLVELIKERIGASQAKLLPNIVNSVGAGSAFPSMISRINDIKEELRQCPELFDELTNAEIGIMQVVLAEYLVTEVSADGVFEESLSMLHSWKPLNAEQSIEKRRMP